MVGFRQEQGISFIRFAPFSPQKLVFSFLLKMGIPEKTQLDGRLDSEGKKWEIVGSTIRTSLKPINTKPRGKDSEEEDEARSTTPTSMEARIPEKLPCPPAPRKRRPPLRCHYGGVGEFFTPDMEKSL